MKYLSTCLLAAMLLSEVSLFSLASDCSVSVIDFEEAYQSIVETAMELKAVESQAAAREAATWQAGLYPNPELSVSVDNMGYNSGCQDGELFVGITQPFELGGKRSARVGVAVAEQCVVLWDHEILRCELFGQILHTFIEIAIAQERLEVVQEHYQAAEQSLSCSKTLTELGKSSLIDVKRAELTCSTAKLALSKQQASLSIAKAKLRTLWDCKAPDFDKVCFPLHEIDPLPPLQELCEALNNNPEIAKAEAEVVRASKVYHLERSQRIPDVAVQLGVSTERFTKHPSVGFEIDIPLPIFNRNQGNICRAVNEQEEAIYRQMNILCHHRSKLLGLYDEWKYAYDQVVELRDNMLAPAAEAYQMTSQGYNEGKFDYNALKEARNTLFEIKQQYLTAVEEYHHKQADVLKMICCLPDN